MTTHTRQHNLSRPFSIAVNSWALPNVLHLSLWDGILRCFITETGKNRLVSRVIAQELPNRLNVLDTPAHIRLRRTTRHRMDRTPDFHDEDV
jgi:hypothetical protein